MIEAVIALGISVVLLIVALKDERRRSRMWQGRAEHYRNVALRAEHALAEIEQAGGYSAFTSGEIIDRIGVDNESRAG